MSSSTSTVSAGAATRSSSSVYPVRLTGFHSKLRSASSRPTGLSHRRWRARTRSRSQPGGPPRPRSGVPRSRAASPSTSSRTSRRRTTPATRRRRTASSPAIARSSATSRSRAGTVERLAELGLQAELIPPGIDLDNFRPLDRPKRDDVLLAIGRSLPLKNLPLTIDAWKRLDAAARALDVRS